MDIEEDNIDELHQVDLFDDIPQKEEKTKKIEKKLKKNYVDPLELHDEIIKHKFNRSINEDYVMDKKLALMCMKITRELYKKGNFRGYFGGWDENMCSKAFENLIKYIHLYDEGFVETPYFFINWIFRVHEQKMRDLFIEFNLDFEEFLGTLPDVKKKFVRKSKDPSKEIKTTYKKISADLLFEFFDKHNECQLCGIEAYSSFYYERYPDLHQMFEEYKVRNAFNYVTQIINRSAQHVIKNENKKKVETQLLNEAIMYKTDDLDEEAIEKDSRFITFDENKIDYGGFDF